MGIGDCHLDLRTAELDGDEITITISQIIGDTTIVVLRHVEVELAGFFLIGEKSLDASEEELPPSAPRVRVRAFGLIGELNVVRR
jgi:predicted membrane protein